MKWYDIKPKFKPDQSVFVVFYDKKNNYHKSYISYIPVNYAIVDGEEFIFHQRLYRLSLVNIKRDDWNWEESYLFETEEEAKENAIFHKIALTDNQWFQIIGNRKKENGLEDCELQPCCNNISLIRNKLLEIKKNKGILEVDRKIFQKYLLNHEPISNLKQTLLFKEVLEPLNLIWQE